MKAVKGTYNAKLWLSRLSLIFQTITSIQIPLTSEKKTLVNLKTMWHWQQNMQKVFIILDEAPYVTGLYSYVH